MEHMTLKPYSCMLARARAGGGSGAKFTIRTARLSLPRPETLVMPNAALFQRAWVHHSCRRDLLVFGTLYMR